MNGRDASDDRAPVAAASTSFAMEARFLSTILDAVASLVLVLDREGHIVYFNRSCERVTGYTFEEVRGRCPWDLFIVPDDIERVRAVFGKLRAGQSNSYDNCWRTKDGQIREIAWTNTILGDERGNVEWVVPTGIDVTDRRAAERRLVESQARYRALFDGGGDAVFVCDASHESGLAILEANAEATRRLGYPREDLRRLRLSDVHADSTPERSELTISRLRDAGAVVFETREQHRDGSTLPVEVRAHLVDLGGRTAILVSSRDLSERKRLEEQLAQASKLEAIGRLAGGVAHDFNNLLVVILSEADAAREALAPDDPIREDLEKILQAGRQAAALTQKLLAFGRKRVMRPVVLDLNRIVEDMGKLLQRLVGEQIRVDIRPKPGLGPVLADEAGVQQVIVNLVVNARDAMPAGGRIIVATEARALSAADASTLELNPGPYAVLSVSDTGVGMNEELRKRVFEPFFTTKEEGRGTGLGLATVFGTVKQAGGHVMVESAPGSGSCFKVLLPEIAGMAVRAAAVARRERPGGEGRTVLVVEDDPAVLGIAIRILEDERYRVLAASDPREALKIAGAFDGAIDVLVSDVIMPHLNGRTLAERLRAARPGMGVVFMSGYTNDVIGRNGALEPGVLFVPKPFARSELLDGVAEAVRLVREAVRQA